PLRKVRGLGSAKTGTGHFWHQRLTAAAGIPLMIFFIGLIAVLNGASYAEVRATLANPFVALALALMLFAMLYHMYIGMQVIIEDYVHGEGGKLVLFALNIFFSFI